MGMTQKLANYLYKNPSGERQNSKNGGDSWSSNYTL